MFFRIFRTSFIFCFVGLISSFFVGFHYTGLWAKAFEFLMIAAILAVLEISLSFDNAIVNAKVLKGMSPVWRHRFLTWGMIIAVFGMRLLFPLVIVAIVAAVNPWEALRMAIFEPPRYAQIMLESHLLVSAFGGSFLLLVALAFFYDENKDHHWIGFLEKRLVKWGHLEALEIFIAIGVLLILCAWIPASDKLAFLQAGLAGILTFLAVKGLGQVLEGASGGDQVSKLTRSGAASFVYLEVLDSSFSFDGVVGAFAITSNLLIIMVGLSIGAFFVRSLTIYFVEKEVLKQFEYLEHGAFYAIGLLAILMLVDPFLHVPEWFTGLSGAVIIVASFFWSVRASQISLSKKMSLK
jgi:hypothetical protein